MIEKYIGSKVVKISLGTYQSPVGILIQAIGSIGRQGSRLCWFNDHNHLFVVGEMGTLLEIAPDGELLAYNSLSSGPNKAIRLPDNQIVLCTDGELLFLDEDGFDVQPFPTKAGNSIALNNTVVSYRYNTVTVTSLATRRSCQQQLAFEPRVVVPFDNGAWLMAVSISLPRPSEPQAIENSGADPQ